ncbi:uncharacterized protein [Hetaerina americana]|uniref:uncharacterized protein n=1 Tax=Hetaerina americana TaxID=62018 RepID=UPI003A7F5DE8
MDAKRRPPPIPEKTVAGMPPAKPPVPGPPPPTQLESGHAAGSRKETEGEGTARGAQATARGGTTSSTAEGAEIQADGGANERFDPPVGGQFTSPAVAIMDPMKKARRKAAHPAYVSQQQQQQSGIQQRGISPSQLPALPFGPAGVGGPPAGPVTNSIGPPAKGTISASSSNGFHTSPDGGPHQMVQNQTAAIQQQTAQKQLRSPTVKRAPGASVTMQGWLHKQGSDGLMLWKRRWFVLSEFCLFYYKGPEEEKVLGSILLPSYVISPCTSDERKRGGNRKHSFKAEHHNMRTYYFAADSLELMERWMHCMNLASFLQKEFTTTAHTERVSWDERQSGRPSVSSFSSLLNQSADDSDSGFHGGRSPKHATIAVGAAATPGQALSVPTWVPKGKKLEEETISETSRERDMVITCRKGASPEVPSLPAEFQPLYANAPPKPRRLNSGGRDYSTSPERSPERKENEEGGIAVQPRGPNEPLMQNGMYAERSARASRPMVAFASIRHERNVTYQQHPPVQPGQHPVIVPPPTQMIFPGVDRRTPDTYGRSNTAEGTTAGVAKMAQNRVDYEDVYNVSHNSDALGRINRWSSGQYDLQHYVPNEIHQNVIQPPPPTHVHHCSPSGHSPQPGHMLHPHGQQLGVMPRMPLSHPYSVSPTTAQHQHPPPMQQYPSPHQLIPPQPQPQVIHRRTPPLPRPHSADFLGHYEQNQFTYVLPLSPNVGSVTPSIEQSSPKMPSPSVGEIHKQQPNTQVIEVREQHTVDIYHGQPVPRPKSSMDIRPYNQGRTFDPADYWSEESYARMMRQSLYLHAQHVHPSSSSSHKGSETSSGLGVQQQPSWPAQPQEAAPPMPTQTQPRPTQNVQKQQAGDALEVWGKTSEDAEVAASSRQNAVSGKRDMHQAGHFLRSASARMPRSRYNSGESPREPSSAMSAISGEEVRYGERKMQQREESMRRLLEWKQRMLQSPLTRKTSSSSGPRKSSQDTSSYNSSQMGSSHYKQMVLKQLANQEAAASTNNWEHVSRRVSSRRGPDDVRTARSRSHDGRRSSASLSRYNSYSSDDEEAMGESRKRVRRGNQAGKGRRGMGGGGGAGEEQPLPSSAQNHPSPMEGPTPHHHIPSPTKSQSQLHHHHRQAPSDQNRAYQNLQPPESNPSKISNSSQPQNMHEVMNFENPRSPQPLDQGYAPSSVDSGGCIPPDASYADVGASTQFDNWWGVGRNGRNTGLDAHLYVPEVQPIAQYGEKKLHFEDEICRRGIEIMAGSSKHGSHIGDKSKNDSDSPSQYLLEQNSSTGNLNYETARMEQVELGGVNEINGNEMGFLKQMPEESSRSHQLVPLDGNTFEEGQTTKLKSRKTLMDLRSKRENPPKNIVQNRIKTFEPNDEEAKDLSRKTLPGSIMKEPIKACHSLYTFNEAHISSLRDSDSTIVEDFMDKTMDLQKGINPGRTSVHNSNNGGATADIESSDDGTSSSPPPPLPVAPPPPLLTSKPIINASKISNPSSAAKGSSPSTRSVRELLADFEKKSEQKKRMMEAQREGQCLDGSNTMDGATMSGNAENDHYYPGRRYVFSDTETLLYDTGSDLDEDADMAQRWKAQRKGILLNNCDNTERKQDKSEEAIASSGDAVEEADSEIESALRQNEMTLENCDGRDLRTVCSPLTGKGAERVTNAMPHVKNDNLPPPPAECKILVEPDEAMEVITTPGYLRLSLAESLVTHEDMISPFGSSATATPPLNNSTNAPEEEQHYMPMTPSRKSILASPSSLQQTGASPTSASHSVIMESVFGSNGAFWAQMDPEEESSYVEMTEEGIVKSLLVSDPLGSTSLAPLSVFSSPSGRAGLELCRKSSGESTATYAVPESPRYSEIPGGSIFDMTPGRGSSAHYELLSRATTLYEPVYMEVRSVKESGHGHEEDTNNHGRILNDKASPEKGKTVSASDEERTFRKEKKKKSKSSSSDREDTGNSSKSNEFNDRRTNCPSENSRSSLGGILPDILNGSSNANNCRLLEGIGTDSSDVGDEDEEDADDEASKDLDSLDAPRHPRFSLSDTFRPASYYLGASDRNFSAGSSGKIGLGGGDSGAVGMGLMNMVSGGDPSSNELHGDSSDSDLVSPPPIPTSPPPPLEDDEDVLGESLMEESDERKNKTMPSSNAHPQLSGALRNPSPGQRPVISPPSVQPEGSSMSDMSDTASTVCSLRRRPVNGNILDNLINSAPNKADIPSELYMRRNEMLSEYSDYKRSGDFDSPLSPSLPPELWPRLEDGLPAVSPEALHRRIASADDAAVLYENVPAIMKHRMNISVIQDGTRPPLPPHRSLSPFVKLPENQSPQHNPPSMKPIPTNSEMMKMSHPNINMMSPDGETPAGAPYYYSDIIRGECEDQGFLSSASDRSVTRNSIHGPSPSWRPGRIPLNNQRDDVQETAAKRNDVGRKVNRIQPPNDIFHGSASHHDPQRAPVSDYQMDNCEGVDKIMAADLLLIGADKHVDVDERNIYETDTLKKASRRRQSKDQQWDSSVQQSSNAAGSPMHRRCYTPDSLPDSRTTRNIYPYGLIDKSAEDNLQGSSHDLQFSDQNGVRERANRWRRRSRSLEGLLDDENESMFHQNPIRSPYTGVSHTRQAPLTYDNSQGNTWATPGQNSTQEVKSSSPASPENRHTTNPTSNGNFNGVDPWSEDNLWRESLRRVSLRHTRSLDHLDDCTPNNPGQANSSGRRSVDLLAAGNTEASRKPRVSRGVTYVNDSVALATERRNRMRALNKPANPNATTAGGAISEEVRQDRRGIDGSLNGPHQNVAGEQQFGRYPPRHGQEHEMPRGPNVPRVAYERGNEHPRGPRRRVVMGGPLAEQQQPQQQPEIVLPPLASSDHHHHHHFLGEDAPPSPPQSPQPQEPGPGFEIDREKLRQWDLMSSAPLPGMAGSAGGGAGAGVGAAAGGGGKGRDGGEGRG